MKTFRKFRSTINDVTEKLEPHHDLSVLEFAAFSEDEIVEDEVDEAEGGSPGPPTNNMGSGHIPGANIPAGSSFGEPGVPVRKKFELVNGPPVDPRLFQGKIFARKAPVGESTVFNVDPATYEQCRIGKAHSHHWSRFVGDSELGEAIKNWKPSQTLIVTNLASGEMLYLRRG
jgi:hypothetical protein